MPEIRRIRQTGSSLAVTIPPNVGFKLGDYVELEFTSTESITIYKIGSASKPKRKAKGKKKK